MTAAHPWRGALAILALAVYATAAFAVLVVYVLPWATSQLGEPWSFTQVSA